MSDTDDTSRALRIETVLGEPPTLTLTELAAAAGVTPERIVQLWTALALALPGPDDVIFTKLDVDAVRLLEELRRDGVVDKASEHAAVRALGQTMSRTAEWQIEIMRKYLAASGIGRLEGAARLFGSIDGLQALVWRRHLLAAGDRAFGDKGSADCVAVGFADVVGFTSLSRGLDLDELAEFLEKFESETTATVSRNNGRVIKMIGDEVMFVTDTALEAAHICLELSSRKRSFDGLPEVRVGVAYGEALRHLGDVHGTVVNMAARLTSLARPGTILADADFAKEIADDAGFKVRPLRHVSVRGFANLQPWLIRAAD